MKIQAVKRLELRFPRSGLSMIVKAEPTEVPKIFESDVRAALAQRVFGIREIVETEAKADKGTTENK